MSLTPLFNFCNGRSTTFAIFFTIAGTTLAFKGHLDSTYVAFIAAIQGLIFCHSLKEDYMDQKVDK